MIWLLPIGILLVFLLFAMLMVRRINQLHQAQFPKPVMETKLIEPTRQVVGPTAGQLLGEVVQKVYVRHVAARGELGAPLALARRAQPAQVPHLLVDDEPEEDLQEEIMEDEREEVVELPTGNLATIYQEEMGTKRMNTLFRLYLAELYRCAAENGGIVSRDSFNEKFKDVWRATTWNFLLSGKGMFTQAGLVKENRLVYSKPEIAIRFFEVWEQKQRAQPDDDEKEEVVDEYQQWQEEQE